MADPGDPDREISWRPVWVVLAVFGLCVGAGVLVSHPWSSGTGDPGGRILAQLRPVRHAVPPNAQINDTQEVEPRVDSCDGRPSTRGCSDVWVVIDFRSPMSSTDLVNYVSEQLRALGWIRNPSPPGIRGGSWKKTLSRASTSSVVLDAGPDPHQWSLAAVAPPAGEAVTGC